MNPFNEKLTLGKIYIGDVNGKLVKVGNIVGTLSEGSFNGKAYVKLVRMNYPGKPVFSFQGPYLKKKISDIGLEDSGKQLSFDVVVDSIIETTGPTIFRFDDGSGSIEAKSFVPGRRAFPELKEGDTIKAKLFLRVFKNKKDAEFISYKRIEGGEREKLLESIESLKEERTKPKKIDFLVKSQCYEKLRDELVKAASIIKRAIIDSRQIIIRHHADCDGYCAAIALERAIIPLIVEQHKNESSAFSYYRRAPSRTPFYEYSDATKDLSYNLQSFYKIGKKPPLIIIVDNGSTEEDLLAIKKVRIYNAQVIVVDHHQPILRNGRSLTSDFVDAHINPYLVGFDANITAGMLCTELSRMINEKISNVDFLAALSGLGDKSKCAEMQEYLKIAESRGFSEDYLRKVAKCVDFEAYYLGFIESRSLVDDLLGSDLNKQKQLVELLNEDIENRKNEQLRIIKAFVKEETLGKVRIYKLNLDDISLRMEFPPPGKITGIAYELYSEKGNVENIIVLGISDDYIVVRSSLPKFNTNKVIEFLKERIGFGFISGGGHERAGTIKFVRGVKDRVIDEIKEYIKGVINTEEQNKQNNM